MTTKRLVSVLGCALAGTLLTTSPVAASVTSNGQLRLSIAQGEVPFPPHAEVTLACFPHGGTHPRADRACRELGTARGDLESLPGDPTIQVCTLDHSPMTVQVTGTWFTERVRFVKTFGNRCQLRQVGGAVFDF